MSSSVKLPLTVTGRSWIGDSIHNRAPVRALMQQYDVTLETSYPSMYHDLIASGLKLSLLNSRTGPRIADSGQKDLSAASAPSARHVKLTDDAASIHRTGSVLAAHFASCGLTIPERPDFSLPVKQEWRDAAKDLISTWNTAKPLLIYRPIVLNRIFECPLRSPDPKTYAALFTEIRERFFVVSVADLRQQEWIVGPEQEADIKLHHGEIDFETLAGLFAEATLVFCNPGFAPLLSQAVGTPTIIVYGGYECFATTHSHSATPTLPIDTDAPCSCFSTRCQLGCSKRIDLASALSRIRYFMSEIILQEQDDHG
jgi:hypothetical protein